MEGRIRREIHSPQYDDRYVGPEHDSKNRVYQDVYQISPWEYAVSEHNQADDGQYLWFRPHFNCGIGCAGFCHSIARLSVLRASRQIYVEASPIFWTTNTFSFANGDTFERFMAMQNINQTCLVRHLHFVMGLHPQEQRAWDNALSISLITTLSGVRSLRLQIVADVENEQWRHLKENLGLLRLSTLPLTSVEVSVRISTYFLGYGRGNGLETKRDRDKIADGLQKMLLNPKGAEVYAESLQTKE
ncbi:MAG: hypothetical protein Q9172_000692 [Xanthocarpia lactea]